MSGFRVLLVIGAAMLCMETASAGQGQSTEWRTKPVPSRKLASKDAAREMAGYARCVVTNRYQRARAVVLAQYASDEQDQLVDKVIRRGDDNCIQGWFDDVRITFTTPVIAGALGQALVLKEYPDLPTVIDRFQLDPKDENARLAQMNAAEVFGRCVVQRNPAGALALLSALPASDAESRAIRGIHQDLGPCLAAGSTLTINAMFLRNTMGVAAYRLAQQVEPRASSSAGDG